MLADKLIVETTDDTDRTGNERRRYYRLTIDGNRVAMHELNRLPAIVSRFRAIPGLGGSVA